MDRRAVGLVLGTILFGLAGIAAPSPTFATERSDAPITDPQFVRAANEAREASDAVRRKRASIEAVQARADSQRAYRSMSVSDAWSLVSQRFPTAAIERLWQPLRLVDGERTEYMSDYVARIERPGKAPLIAYSPLPLRGHGQEIDLGLQDGAGPLVPRNPIVDVKVAREASGGITLPGAGVTVRPVGLADSSAHMMNSRAFFPSVAQDIDQLVLPRPLGAELLWQVRSRDAVEQVRLAIDMPAGASLRLRSETDGGLSAALPGDATHAPASVEIVRDGAVIATLLTPGTAGADGHPLPTWYELDGDQVIVRFPHRNADVEYPLLVDPQVSEPWSGGAWGAGDGWFSENIYYGGWGFSMDRNCCGRYGLQVGAYQGGNYVEGAIGQWSWYTHPNTYIARADFVTEHLADATQIVTGIHRDGVGWELVRVDNECPYPAYCHLPRRFFGHDNPGGADNTRAVFGMHVSPGGVRRYGAFANLDETVIYLGDRHPPTITVHDHEPATPSAWTNADVQYVGFTAHDDGLGLKYAGVARTDRGNPNEGPVPTDYWLSGPIASLCSGNRHFRCQNDFTTNQPAPAPYKDGRMPYYLNPLPEGIHQIRATTHEVAGGDWGNAVFSPTWTVRMDRSGPVIALSGSLYDAGDNLLHDGDYQLRIAATDGDPAPSAPTSARRSGVVSLEVEVDGEKVWEQTQTCPPVDGGCGMTSDWTFVTQEYLGGDHDVVVRARDAAGNASTSVLTVWTNPQSDERDPYEEDTATDSLERTVFSERASTMFCQLLYDPCAEPVSEPMTTSGASSEASAAAVGSGFVWGLSEQGATPFTDDRVKSLKLRGARLVTEYDVVLEALGTPQAGTDETTFYRRTPPPVTGATAVERMNHPSNRLKRVDRWMSKVCPGGQCAWEPLVSFWYDRKDPAHAPTVEEYSQAIKAFRLRYPYVERYTQWNEVNAGRALGNNPFLAGQLWREFDRQCNEGGVQRCIVAGGDFLDATNVNGRPKDYPGGLPGPTTYFEEYVEGMGRKRPVAWGYHAYYTGNALTDDRLRAFVVATRARRPDGSDASPNIWLTEQGGILRRQGRVEERPENQGPTRQQRTIRYLLGHPDTGNQGVINGLPRITHAFTTTTGAGHHNGTRD